MRRPSLTRTMCDDLQGLVELARPALAGATLTPSQRSRGQRALDWIERLVQWHREAHPS